MIPVARPFITTKGIAYVTQALKSGWVSGEGPYVKRFEKQFARFIGVKHAITTTSGTAALHLALSALGLGPGDEVIIPAFTMIATAFAVVYTGAKPVLVDADPKTWNMDITRIEEKITHRTRAIVPVHIYGHPVDMQPLMTIAKKYKLLVIEDAAEALGALYRGKMCGTFGHLGCFSFYANKTITTGEGGMVVTNSAKLAQKIRRLKNLSHSPSKRFLHDYIGFTYRMTNMQAALGLSQLEIIKTLIAKKRRVASIYERGLHSLPELSLPFEKSWAKSVYWVYGLLVNPTSGITRDYLRERLKKSGIDTREFFIPMHEQPVFTKMGLFKNEQYPIAQDLSRRGLYVPSGPNISQSEIKRVCREIQHIYEEL